jgi:uncharacterized protein (DUF1330 family)
MKKIPGIVSSREPQTFEECLQLVNPTAESLAALQAQPDKQAIIMINYLRFRHRRDSYFYSLYGKEAAGEVLKTDSFVYYYGKVIHSFDSDFGFDNSWDGIVMPVYHRRSAYLQLQRSPIYQRAIPYRSAGTSARMLYVLRDRTNKQLPSTEISQLDCMKKAFAPDSKQVVVADLYQLEDSTCLAELDNWMDSNLPLLDSVGASLVLSLEAEIPVLSEQLWDRFNLIQFPCVSALKSLYKNPLWQSALDTRKKLVKSSTSIASTAVALPD